MSDQSLPHFKLRSFKGLFARYGELIQNYASLLGGSVGRLAFSLVYFLVLANTLSVKAFGVVAAASAMGVVLSRVAGLGFSSPLYRIATVKPQLTGVFLGGYIAVFLLTLPLAAALAWLAYQFVFAGQLTVLAFTLIVISEVVLWRNAEIIIIINNGLRRFGLGAALTILGTFTRMCAALAFWQLAPVQTIEIWAWFYFAANAVSLCLICFFGRTQYRLRFVPKLYPRRFRDAAAAAAAEIIFYAQMELDKVLMLALAGNEVTGVYAVVMRLVDLTAMPLRAVNTLLVQSLMRTPELMRSWKRRIMMEAGIALVSTGALLAAAVLLWLQPNLLGKNIALVAPVLMFALAIPATRNIVEYHTELLYARGQTVVRALLLALLGGLKAMLMLLFIVPEIEATALIVWMTVVFAVLYVVSATFTYGLLKRPAAPV